MTEIIYVAEIGSNHEGNFNLAYEMMRRAKMAGATIAKFQFGWRHKEGEINRIDRDVARQLKEWGDYLGIEIMASIIIEESLELAHHIGMERYKIASRTVKENPDLCRKIIDLGHETFVSLGWWEEEDFPFGPPNDKLRYIYCKSNYPTYPKDLADSPNNYSTDEFFGYSDHTHGIAACLMAVSKGARFIEKHFTLNKTSQTIQDHVLSATPEEFLQMTQIGSELSKLAEAIKN